MGDFFVVEMCSVIHILAVNPECQTIADAIIRHPVLILGIYPAGYALCFETCFLKHLPALNQIWQIDDFIVNSSNPVNAQKIPVSNALLF